MLSNYSQKLQFEPPLFNITSYDKMGEISIIVRVVLTLTSLGHFDSRQAIVRRHPFVGFIAAILS